MNLYRIHVFANLRDENLKWHHGRGFFVVADTVGMAVDILSEYVGGVLQLDYGYEVERKAVNVQNVTAPCVLAEDV